jgi:predicted RecA/RadA family phage recombinase
MNISGVVVNSIIAGFTTFGLEVSIFDLPMQFATDVLTGDTH